MIRTSIKPKIAIMYASTIILKCNTVIGLEFEDLSPEAAEVIGGRDVEICVLLTSESLTVLSANLDVTLTPASGEEEAGADGMLP